MRIRALPPVGGACGRRPEIPSDQRLADGEEAGGDECPAKTSRHAIGLSGSTLKIAENKVVTSPREIAVCRSESKKGANALRAPKLPSAA